MNYTTPLSPETHFIHLQGVMLQYLFQSWGFRGPTKYRDMLYNTGTEEIGHIEILATAVAMNLEGTPTHMQEEAVAKNPVVAAIMGGMNPRHFIRTANRACSRRPASSKESNIIFLNGLIGLLSFCSL
jgi:Mn-containing catalase